MSSKGIISLLGCGWLGFPLAKSLVSNGFTVLASTTTESKLEVLKKEGIDPYLVQFSEDVQLPDLKKFFNAETLIITIPPGRRDPNGFENYRRMVQFVCKELPNSKVSKLILTSSTSVYADTNNVIYEFSNISPDTESGQLMAETENRLSRQDVNMISLRLAGLIGPGRMPGKFFAGKTQVPNGLAPVNLIHLNDAIGIIHCLIDQNASGIYNGCAPDHPTREEFYTMAAQKAGLRPPEFLPQKTNWKIIVSERLESELNFKFKFPCPMEWLSSFYVRSDI